MANTESYNYTQQDYEGRFNILTQHRILICKALQKSNWSVRKAMKLNKVIIGEDSYRRMIKRHHIDVVNKKINEIPINESIN